MIPSDNRQRHIDDSVDSPELVKPCVKSTGGTVSVSSADTDLYVNGCTKTKLSPGPIEEDWYELPTRCVSTTMQSGMCI